MNKEETLNVADEKTKYLDKIDKNAEEVAYFTEGLLRELESDTMDIGGRLAVTMRMFTQVCQECNITKENFLYICNQMAKTGQWREWE